MNKDNIDIAEKPLLLSKERAKDTSPMTNLSPRSIWVGDLHPAHLLEIVNDTRNDLNKLVMETDNPEETQQNIVELAIMMAAMRTAQRVAMEMNGLIIESVYNEDGTVKEEKTENKVEDDKSFPDTWRSFTW